MKKRQNNSARASALQITFSVALLFGSVILLAAASVQGVHAALPESSAAPKPTEARKSASVEFSASRERVAGREIAGFSARQARMAQERNLTAPAKLKPVEQEAWLALARRQGASGGYELASLYPKPYGEPFVVEGEGVPGSWVTTGSLATGRYWHTATLLPSGEVLVAGGIFASSNAELYDPVSGTWVTTDSLGTGRYNHTATLLPSGRVLVSGGYNAGYLSSAELYDPASRSWSSTGSLGTARAEHTATLLPNGKVLVAGGYLYLTSAELYDPASGSWTSTGSLGTGRYNHTATLLPSGQVLVAGGFGNSGYLSSAELYDPASGSWSSTGSLGTARAEHTATLLSSGKVLVAGGATNSAELYDPASGSWSSTGSLAKGRSEHTATLLASGEVLVAAGCCGISSTSAELYDPASGSWTSTGSLNTGRYAHTATLLASGEVLVAAGFGTVTFSDIPSFPLSGLTSAELYDPAPVGQITPAGTTCSQFSSDTAETLGSVQYGVKNGLVDRVLPRSFLYWVPVTALAGGNVFEITQTITTGNFDTFLAATGNGSSVFDSNCVSLQRTVRQRGNTVTVKFSAPTAGTYFIAIAFDARSLVGQPAPDPTTVHYEFTTTGVPHSTSGISLIKQ